MMFSTTPLNARLYSFPPLSISLFIAFHRILNQNSFSKKLLEISFPFLFLFIHDRISAALSKKQRSVGGGVCLEFKNFSMRLSSCIRMLMNTNTGPEEAVVQKCLRRVKIFPNFIVYVSKLPYKGNRIFMYSIDFVQEKDILPTFSYPIRSIRGRAWKNVI